MQALSCDAHCTLQDAVLSTHVAPFWHSPALQFSLVPHAGPAYPNGHGLVTVLLVLNALVVVEVAVLLVDVLLLIELLVVFVVVDVLLLLATMLQVCPL